MTPQLIAAIILWGFLRSKGHSLKGITETSQQALEAGFPARGGEMGALMRSFDWSKTALGSIDSWPQSLRTSVSICLNLNAPAILWWGPELSVLYNDSCIPLLGDRHPHQSLGLPGATLWPEAWPRIEPLLMQGLLDGEADCANDLPPFINCSNKTEECYLRFEASQIANELGGIGGVLTTVTNTTRRVIAERRMLTLRELAGCNSKGQSVRQACKSLAEVLENDCLDILFALLYVVSPNGTCAELASTSGVPAGTQLGAQEITLTPEATSRLEKCMYQVAQDHQSRTIVEAASSVVILSCADLGTGGAPALLVAGVNPRKDVDDDYRSFLQRVAQQIGAAVSTARAFGKKTPIAKYSSYQPTDLSVLTKDVASTFCSVMENAGLKFDVDCAALPVPVWVDVRIWKKLVVSLISHAFNTTIKGGVSVRLEEQNGRVILSVQENGIGVPESKMPPAVAELTALIGGQVHARSSVGRGSTFSVSLPFGPLQAEPPDSGSVGGRILLIGDAAETREYARKLLEREYEVQISVNSRDAIALALANPPDIVIFDLMTPELDDDGSLRALRENPRAAGVPVVLLSNRSEEESRGEAGVAGADNYLEKPFTASELMSHVRAQLQLARWRKRAALREAELLSDAEAARDHAVRILERISDGFFTLDHEWRFTYINPAGEKLLRASTSALVGRSHWELFPSTLGTLAEQEFRRAARERVTADFDVPFAPWNRWFAFKVHGTEGGLAVYFRDITNRRQAEEALREGERRFRELADNISQFAWMADETGALFWYNQRWYDYTGTTLEEMRGWGWQSVHHPDHLPRVIDKFQVAIANGHPWEDTFPLRGKRGEWRWFLSRARPIRDENGLIVRWFGTNTDVTEQLETERNLRRANQDLEQFAFSASHDLQEPLRNVAIYSQLLQKHSAALLDPQSQKFLDFVLEGANRMGCLISDLLTYTHAATVDFEQASTVDAEKSLSEALAGLDRAIGESGAVITHEPLPWLAVDDVHLQQLFQNLIGNAIKYRKDELKPLVHVSVTKENSFWQFAISDNGIGIAPEFHDKVFGIFKRLHPKGGKYPGTGIGLAICQRTVERYGGSIWLHSDVGKGTTFYFTLPAATGG